METLFNLVSGGFILALWVFILDFLLHGAARVLPFRAAQRVAEAWAWAVAGALLYCVLLFIGLFFGGLGWIVATDVFGLESFVAGVVAVPIAAAALAALVVGAARGWIAIGDD